jgi:hypothetical protein
MVGHTGIVWNQVWQWLDQVELLRQQVGMRGLAGVKGSESIDDENYHGVLGTCGRRDPAQAMESSCVS